MPYKPSSLPSLDGKVFLVTGGNAGIGYHTAKHLALKGARVYIGARSATKASEAIRKMTQEAPETNIDAHILQMDHMNLSSIVEAVTDFKSKENKLHGLVNNAGIMATPYATSETDGFEAQWQTNYIAHWLLTWKLLDMLIATAQAEAPGSVRIVNVTSNGHSFAPKGGIDFDDINQAKGGLMSRYGMSKLGNILQSNKLHELYGPQSSNRNGIWTAISPSRVHRYCA